jgi:hypothetical protein
MAKRRGDKTPDPPGGRAAERLRMLTESQRYVSEEEVKKREASATDDPPKGNRERPRAKQDRRKD